mmetsp:Transcript_7118/g.18235  ORF Transcript_7118/g.18235 Transcript_7118/m.18235 type:complete len:462 (-) Transcript_7118:164-1549(-)|eukprot:CAMPEP_0119415404 /NCGR_PEP_ID=MMETSP1335-20130426/9112_1 /TAXON_ID=259385 /ORGANISM="Chrysoculter rhomboideus, Strain RCC1486" /LENGTH=461 /DNA_ID=CAMNT_0007440403 /DNA_START=58 /DNA_END=1443 /DNA_ORIENTATION=+
MSAALAHAPAAEATTDLAASLAEAGTVKDVEDVDDAVEQVGLREKESDQVIDKSDRKDALFAVSITSFEDPELGLDPLVLKGLYEMKFSRPSKIQAASLPKITMGRNLLAQAHNGTGKTCCFVLGMLRFVSPEPVPQALCVCPTRELAKQIEEEVLKMGKYLILEKGLKIKCILREERWEKGERLTDQIVIGTPGKIVSLLNLRVLDPASIRMFVLDEADEMLMLGGLGDQSKRIRSRLRKDVQTLFFSATYTEPVKRLATQLSMDNPWSQIEVKREHIFNDQVAQYFYRTNGVTEKLERLTEILSVVNVGQCIIFVHLRDTVDQLKNTLTANGHPVSALHGRMESAARDKVLVEFRGSVTRFLVTTNVLSRGIDVPAVTLVINYDMPVRKGGTSDPDTYLHRVGRTGRFGRKGSALNMIHDDKEMLVLQQIEAYFDRKGMIKEIPPDTDGEEFEKILNVS